MRFRRQDGVSKRMLERTYADYDRRLEARARNMGMHAPAMITTNPFYAAYAPLEWTGPVTYYGWDNWAALTTIEKWWAVFHDVYERISARGHRVCAVSQTLLDTIKPTGPGIVVPNGVVPSEWQPPWEEAPWAKSLPAPHILYGGAIASRLDVDAVKEISQAFPFGSIIFVGPVLDRDVLNRLKRLPNVHVRDPVPRKQIAGLIHSVDVCIMPHLRNELTNSMSPLKIYEYCAAGRPSAATDMTPVRGIHHAVFLVPEGGSFAEAVARALDHGPMAEEDRQDFLEKNSWERRHEEILEFALM